MTMPSPRLAQFSEVHGDITVTSSLQPGGVDQAAGGVRKEVEAHATADHADRYLPYARVSDVQINHSEPSTCSVKLIVGHIRCACAGKLAPLCRH